MLSASVKNAIGAAGIGLAVTLIGTAAMAQAPSTSTNKTVPEHGTASSSSPSKADPIAPGATTSGQPHLPSTTSAAKDGSSHGSEARSPSNAQPIVPGRTGAAAPPTLPSTSTNKSVPEHGTQGR